MADNTTTKNYADGTPLFESDLDDLYTDLQVSKSNLAYSTTGSSSGEVLQSTGSNAEPSWVTADTVAANVTSTGANAIFADISSAGTTGVPAILLAGVSAVTATVANLIGNAIGASGANAVIAAASSVTASAANLIIDAFTRSSTGTTVGLRGIAISTSSDTFTSTSAAMTDVTNLSVEITTGGRPVHLSVQPDGTSGQSGIGFQLAGAADGGAIEVQYLRGTTTVCLYRLASKENGTSSDYALEVTLPPCIDTPAAGTYTYKLQVSSASSIFGTNLTSNQGAIRVYRQKLVAYEL